MFSYEKERSLELTTNDPTNGLQTRLPEDTNTPRRRHHDIIPDSVSGSQGFSHELRRFFWITWHWFVNEERLVVANPDPQHRARLFEVARVYAHPVASPSHLHASLHRVDKQVTHLVREDLLAPANLA